MELKKMIKVTKILVLSMVVSLVLQFAVPVLQMNPITAQAATKKTVKLNVTKKTLTVGQSFQLRILGTTKKIAWSSSKKSIAIVSKSGKVTAKAVGTATITARVDNKKYTCKVTVKAHSNPYVAKAPFEAQEVSMGTYLGVIPKSWKATKNTVYGDDIMILHPADADLTTGSSNITLLYEKSDANQDQFDTYKAAIEEQVTEDMLREQLSTSLGVEVSLKDFTTKTVKKNAVNFEAISYSVLYENTPILKQTMYYLFADGYTTVITMTDNLSDTVPLVNDVTDYLISSLTLKK